MANEESLEELLDRWEESREKGRELTPEQLCADEPGLLDELRRRIGDVQAVERFLQTADDADAEAAAGEALASFRAGRYRPTQLLAPGGLGEVFRAVDEELHREVALKRLHPRRAWDRSARRRFLFEAEITGRLEHPGVVPVYGLGRDPQGQPYYAMRLIRGTTLDEAIEKYHASESAGQGPGERALAFQKLLRSFLSVCQTIGYAHSRGVLHRDLKPQNIMVGDYGETLVVDWGLAKLSLTPSGEAEPAEVAPGPLAESSREAGSPDLSLTEMGQAKGSPAYMSPEQAEGRWDQVGRATDVFGLGATLYKLLTGRAPFQGQSRDEVLAKVQRGQLVRPRLAKASTPRALEAICLKAMATDIADRYAGRRNWQRTSSTGWQMNP